MLVTFCGHSRVSNTAAVADALKTVVEELISEGADEFYLGGYGEFDSIAAHVVYDLKALHPEIKSYLVIPYLNREYYTKLYDDCIYPPLESVPLKFAISKRNEWMVDQADVVVAHVLYSWGGAAATLNYAKRKKKRIISVP